MSDDNDLQAATSAFGKAARAKLSAAAVSGQPEEQLRGPLETYIRALAALAGLDPTGVVLVGESSLAKLQVRPDFAVTVGGVLVGFIEIKAPGKGADPRRFTGKHDKTQWAKLSALPNLMYTDGNEFSVWNYGERDFSTQRLTGDVETAGTALQAPAGLVGLIARFLTWAPQAPTGPAQLAHTAARLCRLLREEVAEQLVAKNPVLIGLASDWRHLLFPDASDEQFADSYAQAVTFGLLMARVRGIDLDQGVSAAAAELAAEQHTLVGTALRILTDGQLAKSTLQTSVATLTRTLSAVDWPKLSKGDPNVWLYFYEDFLAEYDPALRKKTGSYYTPVDVVRTMTRLVDEALTVRFDLLGGLAEPTVTVLDPALGTGTYLLEVVRRIAQRISDDQGDGAVPAALADTVRRLVGFELQMGPFAVAQLRLLAELTEFGVPAADQSKLRTYVTNTLDDPLVEETKLGTWYEPIAQSRRDANKIKADEPVVVVIGNPPYKDKSQGTGGFVEHGEPGSGREAPLARFIPDKSLGVAAHVKHLYNPYVYFWRWATDKVFDQHPEANRGVVCFITVAGFLGGPGFKQMRAYLRDRADAVYVIDCTPEGHQPPVNSRVFQGVQQPVCITIVIRDGSTGTTPAPVHYRALTAGHRTAKFAELATVTLSDDGWQPAATDLYAPFWPAPDASWLSYPSLDDIFLYSGAGTMVGRTWPIAPDRQTLEDRWTTLIAAPSEHKPELLQEHARDRHVHKKLTDNLPGYPRPTCAIGDETDVVPDPVRYAYRSFDRQWIIPDKRLINQPNPTLWRMRGDSQIYLTSPVHPPTGPAVTFTAVVPDLDHYNNRGGRAWPLWRDADGTIANTTPKLLTVLSDRLCRTVHAPDVMAYVAAVLAHPGYVKRFTDDLAIPGIRIPITADPDVFEEAVQIGRRILWLHSYGTRCVDATANRPTGAPRLPAHRAPKVLAGHPIPADADGMPDNLGYDPDAQTLTIGDGRIGPVTADVWSYTVGNKRILTQWFSYRRKNRERPTIGDRRNSPLSNIQPAHWLPEYTADLIDLLHVLTLLTDIHSDQDDLLDKIVDGAVVTANDLTAAGVLPVPDHVRKNAGKPADNEFPDDPDTLPFG